MTFEEAVESESGRMFRVAYLYLHDRMAAEDAVQDAFLRYLAVADNVREPRAWLARVVRNVCLNQLRKQRRATLTDPADLPDQAPSAFDASASRNSAQRDLAGTAETRMLVTDALLQLPLAYREVLVWHYYLGVPAKDLAERLDLTPEAVRTRLHRARHAMAQQLNLEEVSVP